MASVALIVVTLAYVVLTGILVFINWRQLRLGANPTVYPEFTSISLVDTPDGVTADVRVTMRTLSARPAVNVLLDGRITLLATGESAVREMKFGDPVVAALEPGRQIMSQYSMALPELGLAGADDVRIPVFAYLVADYSDTTGTRYRSLMNLNAYVSFRTPDTRGSSRGVDVSHGMLTSVSIAQTRWNRLRTAAKKGLNRVASPFRRVRAWIGRK